MSKVISQEKLLNPELLTEHEIWYLHTRGRLPKGVEVPTSAPSGIYSSSDSRISTASVSSDDEGEESLGTPPTIKANGGIIEEDDSLVETYQEGWTNNQRRAELARRGLSIDGSKNDLATRLMRSDSDELTEDDRSVII